ncbi:MAG TPA: hypothetical protein VIL35_14745 [Vicinamibacterales bacterium]
MLEPGEVRKRLRQKIEAIRREAAARRQAVSEVQREYDRFLEDRAVPVFRQMASALRAEGFLFQLLTPAGSVRLASERSGDDYIELALDTTEHPPVVVGRTSFVRGSRLTTSEAPIREGRHVRDLTDEDVLEYLLRVVGPFVER